MKAITIATVFCIFASSRADDPLCVGVPPGEIYLFPYPGDCRRYYECVDGTQIAKNCDDGEWFNEALQSCDHPETSGCINIACPPGVVDFYPVPGNCSEYMECYQGELETHVCPDGLWFNAQEKRCVSEEQSACGQYTSPFTPTYTSAPEACDGVLPGYILLKPYPGDCNKFIECIGSQLTVLSCPPYLYFDYNRQMCDQKELSDCDDTTGTQPHYTTLTPPPEGFDDPRCANGNNDYWPDVICSKFVECWQGHGYTMECPSGLYFNEYTKTCVDPSESTCGYTEPTQPTRSTPPDWTPDPRCPWPSTDRYLYAYPGDCTKYLECSNGELEVMPCPPSLWFNPNLLVCDYPYHSGCIYQKDFPIDEE